MLTEILVPISIFAAIFGIVFVVIIRQEPGKNGHD